METLPKGPLSATLTEAHRHRRLNRASQFLLGYLAVLAFAVCLLLVADNLLNLSPTFRLTALVVVIAANGWALFYLLWRIWFRRLALRPLAVRLERLYGIGDNSLINAVCFSADAALSPRLREAFFSRAAETCKRVSPWRLWNRDRLLRLGTLLLGAFIIAGTYLCCFTDHAQNALIRYLNPHTDLTPLNYTSFHVSPGDVRIAEGTDLTIRAKAEKLGRSARRLQILVRDQQAVLYPMKRQQDDWAFFLREVRESFKYSIRNGNDASRWYRVSVMPRPKLDELDIRIQPPAYTGLPARELAPTERQVDVLSGSQVTIAARGARQARVLLRRDGRSDLQGNAGSWALPLTESTELSLDLRTAEGLVYPRAWACRFEVFADRIPVVHFLNGDLNQEVAQQQTVPLDIEARDDFGLSRLALLLKREEGDEILKEFRYIQAENTRRETYLLTIDGKRFVPNASYRIFARAWDTHEPPNMAETLIPMTLHIMDLDALAELAAAGPYASVFALLSDALVQQKHTQSWLSTVISRFRNDVERPQLEKQQSAVHRLIDRAAARIGKLDIPDRDVPQRIREGVVSLRDGNSKEAVRLVATLGQLTEAEARKRRLNEVVFSQGEIIRELQSLLGIIARQQKPAASDTAMAPEEQDQVLRKKLETLKEELAKFGEGQRKMLDKLESIDKKNPEDWTEDEEKLLGDLAAREAELSHFFKAAFNDLSKLQNQDFSNSMMAEELVELYEELQKSGDALKADKKEIATAVESMGVELAESIETNIERWLADSADSTKWNGEQPEDTPDVPLQDLPEELTDIVGDLIDSVDEMSDVEDSTNNYLGSFDEGIGWGVSDGNLDDMSAKGITGNIMPNNNEVGGRSGEGRSGKSSGQFVEQEATGKGGRDTPTRLTQSPFEAGTVKDTSTDPQGGATGGGKQSGLGGEGLRGITPERDPKVDQRLPAKHAELKQQAEALMRELTVRHLPTGDLETAISLLGELEQRPGNAPGLAPRQLKGELLTALRDAKSVLETGVTSGVERSRRQRAANRLTKLETKERIPKGYDDPVQAYFQALAAEPAD